MICLNTVRAGRNIDYYMENLILNVFSDQRSIQKKGYGVLSGTAEEVVNSFRMVQNTYKVYMPIKVHYMELYVDYGDVDTAFITNAMGQYFWQLGFQCLISVVDTGERYVLAIVINAASYQGNQLFHDNNNQHYIIYLYLIKILPCGVKVTVTDNTIFDKSAEGNYIHGMYT